MRNERYSTKEEIKKVLKPNVAGSVLFVDPDTHESYNLDSESNAIFLGTTGSGKTRRGTIPLLLSCLKNDENVIAVDSKGILLEETIGEAQARGYETIVLNFRDIENSAGFNPLTYPYSLYKIGSDSSIQLAYELVAKVGESIYQHSPGSSEDPFWVESARNTFESAVHILFKYGSKEQINIQNVYRVISEGVMRTASQRYFEYLCEAEPAEPFSFMLQHLTTACPDTLNSILCVTYKGLNTMIKSPALMKIFSADDFISSLDGRKKTAIYIVTPDESEYYSMVSGVLVDQIMSHLIRVAHEKYSGCLPRRVNCVIEELGNIGGAIPSLPTLMSAARSRNIRMFIVLQSYSQLNDLYGNARATTITSNADTIVAFRTTHMETLKELSEKVGYREVDYGDHRENEALISPVQIGAMEVGQALVIIAGRYKFCTSLPDFTEIFETKPYQTPKIGERPIYRTEKFSLKKLVDTIRRHTISEDSDLESIMRRINKKIADLERENS